MIRSAITVCLVNEAKAGPFVFHDGLEASCAQAHMLGFDAIELFPPDAEAVDGERLRGELEQHSLQLAAVGTGAGWLRQKLSLTSSDAGVRQRARAFIAATIDFAARFGAPAIIGSMQGKAEGEVSRDQALGWLGEALEELGARAQAAGTPLLLEPLNRYETNLLNNVAQSLAFLARLRTQNVKLLCDLFHMNIEEVDIAVALSQAGRLVGHVHFADSNRRAVGFGHTHMPPIITVLRRLQYGGYLSAEILPLPDAAAAARQTITSFRQLTSNH